MFLYIGSRILHGEIPYRDIWDHKGPAIFLINAAGVALGSDSQWGMRLLEWLSLCTATLTGYVTMRRLWGAFPAFFATVAWVSLLPLLLDGGNSVEEYALPLHFGALWLFVTCKKENSGFFNWFGLGVTGASAFLLRQNLAGLWISMLLALLVQAVLYHRWREASRRFLALFIGAMVPIGIASIYFAWQNALPDLWSDYFLYNFAYANASTVARLGVALLGMGLTSTSGLFLFSAIGWVLLIVHRRSRAQRASWLGDTGHDVAILLATAFPLEIVLSSISGSRFSHYFISWLPVSAMLAAASISQVLELSPGVLQSRLFSIRSLKVGLLLAACLGPTILGLKYLADGIGTPNVRRQVSEYITASTQETDSIVDPVVKTSRRDFLR